MARIRSIAKECWLLLGFYLGSRLINLSLLPVFCDEAIHIHAAQRMILARDPSYPFQTVSPNFALDWFTAAFVWLPLDPLLSARVASVLAGTLSLVGVYLVARILYSERIAAMAAALYAVSPLTLMHERMLLADVLLNTCATYSLLFSLLALRKGGLRSTVGLGLSLGFGMLSKLTGVFFVLTPLVVWALISRVKLGVLIKRLSLAYLIAGFLISPVLLHPLRARAFVEIERKTIVASRGLTTSEWIKQVLTNTTTALSEVSTYVTTPLLVVLGLSLALVLVLRNREGGLLWMLSLVPTLGLIGSSKGWLPPRFFLVTLGPLMITAAWSIEQVSRGFAHGGGRLTTMSAWAFSCRRKRLCICIAVLMAVSVHAARLDYYILTSPSQAPLPPAERYQYITGWPSGYGIPEAVRWLRRQARREHIQVITDTRSGIPGDALQMYLHRNEGITILAQNLDGPVAPTACREGDFLIVNTPPDIDLPGLNPGTELLVRYHKPGGSSAIEIYKCP